MSRKLYAVLDAVDFSGFWDSYEVNGTDNAGSSLRIDYGHDKFKLVHDYGVRGSFSLVAIYRLMAAIRDTRHWTAVKSTGGYGPGSCEDWPNSNRIK